MRIFNLVCTSSDKDSNKCHNIVVARLQDVVSISHIDNNHIVLFKSDYDENGYIDKNIHLLCWQLGGIVKKRDGKIIKNNNISSNPKNRQVEELPGTNFINRILGR